MTLTRPYQLTDLALDQYKIVLPIITSRGVKYTHNDISHSTLLTHSRGLGLGLIPTASDPEEVVMRDPYVIAVNRRPQHIDALIRFMIRWLVIANIVLAIFTVFNLYIYPEHIYEPPEPVLHSPHVDTLHPYEV